MDNGMIKVITGVRRSGKSFLLFKLFTKLTGRKELDLFGVVAPISSLLALFSNAGVTVCN